MFVHYKAFYSVSCQLQAPSTVTKARTRTCVAVNMPCTHQHTCFYSPLSSSASVFPGAEISASHTRPTSEKQVDSEWGGPASSWHVLHHCPDHMGEEVGPQESLLTVSRRRPKAGEGQSLPQNHTGVSSQTEFYPLHTTLLPNTELKRINPSQGQSLLGKGLLM